jgi:hypothetical protein
MTNWPGFLRESGLNAVLFLEGGRTSLSQVEEAIQVGLPVGLLPPLTMKPSSWRELFASGQCRILNPHHEDPDFRAAMACIKSGELAPLKIIKRISWVGELVVPEGARAIALDEWLPRLLWEDVDQLLHLAGEPPAWLYAVDFSTDPKGYCVLFGFPNGLTAHLERRRGTGIPVELSWTLGSDVGGYANGHRHIKTSDGELYEVPVEIPPISTLLLATPLDHLSPSAQGEPAAGHIWQIVEILEAITHSARTGRAVALS